MNTQNTTPPDAQKIIKRAPHRFTDRDELRVAIRDALLSGDKLRLAALSKRADKLQAQWRARNPEKVAELQREQQEEEAWRNHVEEVSRRMTSGDLEAMEVLTCLHHERLKANNRAGEIRAEASAEIEAQRRRADRAEAGQTPRGVPFEKTSLATKPDSHEFTTTDFCEALKREKGHEAAIRRALASWGKGTKRGSRWALTRAQAKAFWEWHDKARHKTHPPREKNKIARK